MNEDDKVKKILIKLLVDNGYVLESSSYYGDTYDYDLTKRLASMEINFSACNEPTTGQDCKFNGTFNEPEYITYLEGVVHYKGGQSYTYHWKFDEPLELSEMIRLCLGYINHD